MPARPVTSATSGRRVTDIDDAGLQRWLDDYVDAWKTYNPVFLCRFDAEGRCREFTEVFIRRGD